MTEHAANHDLIDIGFSSCDNEDFDRDQLWRRQVLLELVRDGVVDLTEIQVQRLSPRALEGLHRIGVISYLPQSRTTAESDEINRACKRFVEASETSPASGMNRLKAMIRARQQLEIALAEASKSREVEPADRGAVRCLVVCQAVVDPLIEPVWRTFVPTIGFWLQDRIVGLIEDAVAAFRRFVITLSTEDRRRTLKALLAGGCWAADLLAASGLQASAYGDAAEVDSTPQVEAAGGWLGLYVPTL